MPRRIIVFGAEASQHFPCCACLGALNPGPKKTLYVSKHIVITFLYEKITYKSRRAAMSPPVSPNPRTIPKMPKRVSYLSLSQCRRISKKDIRLAFKHGLSYPIIIKLDLSQTPKNKDSPSISAAAKTTKQSLSTAIPGQADGRALVQKVAVQLCHNLVEAPCHQRSLV